MTRLRRLRHEAIQNARIVAHLPLARKLAAAAYRRLPNHPFEDILAAANVGLTQAGRSFDPKRGVPFDAFARRRVSGEIIDSHRKLHKVQYVNEFPPEPVDLVDWFAKAGTDSLGRAFIPLWKSLTDLERHIVELRYTRDFNMLQIGIEVHLSENRVSQLHRGALVKLGDAVKRSGLTIADLR